MYDVILPTVSTKHGRGGAAEMFARLKRSDVRVARQRELWTDRVFELCYRSSSGAGGRQRHGSFDALWRGCRSFKRRRRRERRRSWRETFDLAGSSMSALRKDCRRLREEAACSSIVSIYCASETRGPARTRRQTIEATISKGQAIADENSKRRSSNRLVSPARRHTDQLSAPSTIVSDGRRLYSDPLPRRMDWRWGREEGPTSIRGPSAHRSEIPVGLQHKLTSQVISIVSKWFSMSWHCRSSV